MSALIENPIESVHQIKRLILRPCDYPSFLLMSTFFHLSRVPRSVLNHFAKIGISQLLLIKRQILQPKCVFVYLKFRIHSSMCKIERVLVEIFKNNSLTKELDICVIECHELSHFLKIDTSTHLTTQLEDSLVFFREPKCGEPK